jgi:hypothetical protein
MHSDLTEVAGETRLEECALLGRKRPATAAQQSESRCEIAGEGGLLIGAGMAAVECLAVVFFPVWLPSYLFFLTTGAQPLDRRRSPSRFSCVKRACRFGHLQDVLGYSIGLSLVSITRLTDSELGLDGMSAYQPLHGPIANRCLQVKNRVNSRLLGGRLLS